MLVRMIKADDLWLTHRAVAITRKLFKADQIARCDSPEYEEEEQQDSNNEQNQVWHYFRLHVLLVVWCIEAGLKLDVSCRGYFGIQTAGLQGTKARVAKKQ